MARIVIYALPRTSQIMAKLGFRSMKEMVGRTDKLRMNESYRNYKTSGLDLSPILTLATSLRAGVPTVNVEEQKHALADRKDNLVCGMCVTAMSKDTMLNPMFLCNAVG